MRWRIRSHVCSCCSSLTPAPLSVHVDLFADVAAAGMSVLAYDAVNPPQPASLYQRSRGHRANTEGAAAHAAASGAVGSSAAASGCSRRPSLETYSVVNDSRHAASSKLPPWRAPTLLMPWDEPWGGGTEEEEDWHIGGKDATAERPTNKAAAQDRSLKPSASEPQIKAGVATASSSMSSTSCLAQTYSATQTTERRTLHQRPDRAVTGAGKRLAPQPVFHLGQPGLSNVILRGPMPILAVALARNGVTPSPTFRAPPPPSPAV